MDQDRALDEGYRELDEASVPAFAAPFLRGVVNRAEEIGDGNLNRVFRVSSAHGSVVVKQALPYLKVAGAAWPLTRQRARIEYDAIVAHSKLAPAALIPVIDFDQAMSALVLEDLVDHVTLRELLIDGEPVSAVCEQVATYSAAVLLGTSDLLLPSRECQALRRRFGYSELCLVTEELIFTAPFTGAASNRYDPEIADLARAIVSDRALRMAAAELRFAFKTRDEALVHGDLHTGSVLVHAGVATVIDLEFAFFGPMGFDPGLFLANLAMARNAHASSGHDAMCRRIDEAAQTYWEVFAEECRRRWQPTEPWFNRFLAHVRTDAARFAGTEMIRRIVGLAHVKDVDDLPPDPRFAAQCACLAGGRALMLAPACPSFDELWQRATQEEMYA